jgi:TATA-box binding protein (TBP) (component of TFIID and TFIIIB)
MKKSIVNVFATAALCQTLDFCELRERKEIFHDSDVYGGRVAYYKTPSMEGRVSLFPSGKMISVGTKSEKKAALELEAAMDFLAAKGFVKKLGLIPKIQNLVVTVDLQHNIGLEELAQRLEGICEAEQFQE